MTELFFVVLLFRDFVILRILALRRDLIPAGIAPYVGVPRKAGSMRITPLTLAIVSIVGILAPNLSHADDTVKQRTIEVTGTAEVSVPPDLAIISLAVETTAKEATSAVEQNAARTAKVAAALKPKLGPKDRSSTTRYALEPRYQQEERGSTNAPTITGYVAYNEVRIEIHALDAVGQLIDAGVTAGANRVSQLEFTLEDRNPTLRTALNQAGSEARAQAESVATALGVRLKQVVTASSQSPMMPRRYEGVAMRAAAESRAPTQVDPADVTVSATLHVVYEIE